MILCLGADKSFEPMIRVQMAQARRFGWRVALYDLGGLDMGVPWSIGVIVFDQAKRDPAWTHCLKTFGPHWMPGETIVCLLDFWFYQKLEAQGDPRTDEYKCQKRWAEAHRDALEPMPELQAGTAEFLRYVKPIDWSTI